MDLPEKKKLPPAVPPTTLRVAVMHAVFSNKNATDLRRWLSIKARGSVRPSLCNDLESRPNAEDMNVLPSSATSDWVVRAYVEYPVMAADLVMASPVNRSTSLYRSSKENWKARRVTGTPPGVSKHKSRSTEVPESMWIWPNIPSHPLLTPARDES